MRYENVVASMKLAMFLELGLVLFPLTDCANPPTQPVRHTNQLTSSQRILLSFDCAQHLTEHRLHLASYNLHGAKPSVQRFLPYSIIMTT